MHLQSPIIIFLAIGIFLIVLLFAFALLAVLDQIMGTPLKEHAVVKQRKFSPATLIYSGKVMVPVAKYWSLKVENESGKGVVHVSEQVYESTQEGETVLVTGKRGRFTGNWYLKRMD